LHRLKKVKVTSAGVMPTSRRQFDGGEDAPQLARKPTAGACRCFPRLSDVFPRGPRSGASCTLSLDPALGLLASGISTRADRTVGLGRYGAARSARRLTNRSFSLHRPRGRGRSSEWSLLRTAPAFRRCSVGFALDLLPVQGLLKRHPNRDDRDKGEKLSEPSHWFILNQGETRSERAYLCRQPGYSI
jgi:hypothetical protein